MKKGELVYGVGINDADYSVYKTAKVDGKRKIIWHCPAYKVWSNMFRRSYDELYKVRYPTYVGVSVGIGWHRFTSFKAWWDTQPHTEGLSLDKDLKVVGNKIYSAETCMMVPDQVNALFTDRGRARGKLPLGVTYRIHTGKYMAQIQLGLGKGHKNLGSFSTPKEAHKAWQKAKANVTSEIIEWYNGHPAFNVEVVNALQNRIDTLLSNHANNEETIKL